MQKYLPASHDMNVIVKLSGFSLRKLIGSKFFATGIFSSFIKRKNIRVNVLLSGKVTDVCLLKLVY